MVLETPGWALILEKLAPYIVFVGGIVWRERGTSSKDRGTLKGLSETVAKNTNLLESHAISITAHTTMLEVFKSDRTKDELLLKEIDGKLNRLLGERDGERAAEDRARRK